MAESIGNQALRMANTVNRIQDSSALRENAALRGQQMIDEKQKETYTNAWADELVKNPNAKMPDDLPFGVKYSAKVLAAKAQTDFATLDRQRFARDAETYSQDLDAARASLTTGKREFYKAPVLKALSRIRDGNSDWREEENGQWSYLKNSDNKRYMTKEPDAKFIANYLDAHRDVKQYLGVKVAETK